MTVHPDRVSVVIPCYRGARYVRGAIASCLAQTYPDVEVLVVDDKSPENDAEIADEVAAADPRVKVIRHPVNRGVSAAFNTGFAAAAGGYLTRLAQDDLFRADAFQVMVDHFRAAPPEVGLVYCDVQIIDEGGAVTLDRLVCNPPATALLPCNRIGNCVMWRRAVWDAVGGFRKRFDLSEDYDFYLRVLDQYAVSKVPDAAPFYFRWHTGQGGNVSGKRQDVTACLAQLAYQWRRVRRNPADAAAWVRVAGRAARLPGLWARARAAKRGGS